MSLKNYKEVPTGGKILEAGNSVEYKTGNWRTFRPIHDKEKCTNCMICWMICPDSCVKVGTVDCPEKGKKGISDNPKMGNFGGFDYLVEARWRKAPPTLDDLLAFKGKIDRKIAGTRGFFISAVGFRPEIIQRLREAGPANLILLDGYDLTLILEGRVSLTDGLQAKIDKASQEGTLFYQLSNLFQ